MMNTTTNKSSNSWREWLTSTPWGTTPLGLAARLLCGAIASWAILGWNLVPIPDEFENWPMVAFALTFYALAFLVPWVVERAGVQRPSISQATDRLWFIPTIVCTVVVLLSVSVLSWRLIGAIIAAAQTVAAVGPAVAPRLYAYRR